MNHIEAKIESMEIGLPENDREGLVQPLNELLADMHVLYVKARNFHWNITGDHFFVLHAEFEKLYGGIADEIDEVAERVRALGGVPSGSMAQFLANARLKEASRTPDTPVPDAHAMVSELLSDYEFLIVTLRGLVDLAGDANDAGTEDFCTGLMQGYEKTAWMLRSFLR